MRSDSSGEVFDTIFDVISLGMSIAEVAANPCDPMAWAGLVGDVIDVAVPCVSGVGEVVRGISGARKAIDGAGAVADAASTAQRGWKLGDDIRNLTKAGNKPSWTTVRQRFWKNEAYFNPEKYGDNVSLMRKGRAPIGNDGHPMELHHPNGRSGDNFFIFEPLTQTEHRFRHYGPR